MNWLSTAVRRVLSIASPYPEGLPKDLKSNAEKRRSLLQLGKMARTLSDDLDELDLDTLQTISMGMQNDGWLEFCLTINRLRFIADSFGIIASTLKVERGPWKSSAKRELRVRQAHYLSPIFEMAFGQEATVNDWPDAKDLGPWPDFFQRIAAIANGDPVRGLREVVKEARQRHGAAPMQYPDTLIPC